MKEISVFLHEYHLKSDLKGIQAILLQYALIMIISMGIYMLFEYANIYFAIILYPFLAFILAGIYLGFFFLLHESIHKNLFKNKWLNTNIDILGAFLIFQDVNSYKDWHFRHHKHLGTHEDPEEELKIRWRTEESNFTKLFLYNFITLFYTVDWVKYEVIPYILNSYRFRQKILFWMLIILFFIIIGVKYLFIIYLIPIFLFYPYIYFISVYHEHISLRNEHTNIFDLTRNNNKGFLNKYFLHRYNDGYHSLHHFDPSIPFYLLPSAHNSLKNKYNINFIEESFLQTIENLAQYDNN